MFHIDYNSYLLRLVEWCYSYPEGPPRKRDPTKPMPVIAVGLSRSGTESLQTALIKLGYDYTYHGFDMLFDMPSYNQAWTTLCKKKFYSPTGDCHITAAEFDKILGHAIAICDVPASLFAAELIEAYPDAKIILNRQRDLDAWHRSIIRNVVVEIGESRLKWTMTWFSAHMFWVQTSLCRYMFPRQFKSTDSTMSSGIRTQGKWQSREHYNMIRGLLRSRGETHRSLEWSVEDGWEPLCKFLDKPVPDEPFPSTNNAAGFDAKTDKFMKIHMMRCFRNMGLSITVLGLAVALAWRKWWS